MNSLNVKSDTAPSISISQSEINGIVWRACDSFRGAVDPSEYKNYILTMLFLVYLSHLWKAKREEYRRRYNGDEARVERAMRLERFVLPDDCDFAALYAQRHHEKIGDKINKALEAIEDANKSKLSGVFRNIDFNSEAALGQPLEKNRRLKNLLEDFADPKLDFALTHAERRDVFGDVYEYLIDRFASDAGKKAGEFYTPKEVSQLLARLVDPQPGDRICDPTCGSGSLLIQVAHQVKNPDGTPSPNFSLFGQENNGATWALCRMNMFLHEMDAATIKWGDTLNNPQLIEGDRLMKFEVVVANPPFSLDKWGAEGALSEAGLDKKNPSSRGFNRFTRGVPPKSKADYAFILHMIETATQDGGRVGVIAPHGVLFRGGQEGAIRRKLIEENLLDAVIGLPTNLFFGTGIPATILLFKRNRTLTDVLFIDASKDFRDDKKQNKLREEDMQRIVAAHHGFAGIEKYAHRATFQEISDNDFNLNIARYVDTSEAESQIDVAALQSEIEDLELQLANTRAQMDGFLEELGLK
ncbi:MAG TPA: type I restriction-modification system subunit M [Abditibacterium sp.]|jgi:type I restriction enzyme M protein